MSVSPPIALITGAARRIGHHFASTLHAKGYQIIVHYNQSRSEAEQLCRSLNQLRAESAVTIQADLCDMQQVANLAKQVTEISTRLDVLINNASAFYPTPVGQIQTQDWLTLMGSNVQGPLFLTQALSQQLKDSGGCVINMVDIHAERPLPGHSVYCAAKSALASVTRSLAIELAPAIRVNGIAPGAILWPERPLSEAQKQHLLQSIPLQQLGSVEALSHTAEFLIGNPYITGQIIAIDGGRSIASQAAV
ncbi:pteridine reductase [Salinimonas marina]|uniref:Pteridine reductase n=1 Tax=Salinimonas marina TaxID=2785918 RepID=A0A7S9DWL1_9ALTE|nr:pteridine reductase [Salinimonas marina]QPG04570.1 pteridine reductase [Salinimonas marina]